MKRVLNADTPAGDALWAVGLQGNEGVSELFEWQVSFKSLSPDIDCQSLIGEACDLSLELQGGAQRHLHGHMVRFGLTGRAGEHWTYEALVRPRLWHASRRSDSRIWQNRTVPDILQEILSANAIVFELRLKESYRRWDYLTQYRESDLNFISRLMEHEGICYWFEHSAGQHLMVLGDHFSTHEAYPGYASVPWYPPDHAYPDEDHFHAWGAAREVQTGRYTHSDYDFKHPAANLTTVAVDPLGHLYDHYETYDFPGGYSDPDVGQRYAQVRLQALQAAQDRVQGQGRVRGAAPGRRLSLRRHPRADQNRELLVLHAQYHIANNAYEGAGGAEHSHFEVSIQAIPAHTQYRPLRATPKPHTQGPESAVVVGPPGQEIHTDEHGRVKVKFHWDRYGKKDGTDSCWIRVSHPWAGQNFGAIAIPRVGQEVIVDFLNGDPDCPLITGRVYNAEQMPPWALPGNATQSGILTRSSLKGTQDNANALRFEDKKGAEQLWLHAERDQLSEVEHDEDKWVGNDRRKTIEHDETSHIRHDRSETVGHDETITVHGQRTEVVDGNETITVHSHRSERVDRNEAISIGQNRSEEVGINEALSVGVNQTESIGSNRKVRVGSKDSLKVGFSRNATVGLSDTTSVGLIKMTNVGALHSINVAGVMNTAVLGLSLEEVGVNKQILVGSELKINAGSSIQLTCGNAMIAMDKSGVIKIVGTTVHIEGQQVLHAQGTVSTPAPPVQVPSGGTGASSMAGWAAGAGAGSAIGQAQKILGLVQQVSGVASALSSGNVLGVLGAASALLGGNGEPVSPAGAAAKGGIIGDHWGVGQ